jgi:D-lactate dehydrogenase
MGATAAFTTLAARAGVRLHVPEAIAGLCCGTPWSSKGLPGGYALMQRRVLTTLRAATRGGALPVVSDAVSCSEGFERLVAAGGGGFKVVDAVAFTATTLLPKLTVSRKLRSLALHPTCTSTRSGLNDTLLTLARAVAEEAVVPEGWMCCGFAGDRGLLRPELTAAATRAEAASVAQRDFTAYASVNRTCEIGMTRATGRPYQHLLEIVEKATR